MSGWAIAAALYGLGVMLLWGVGIAFAVDSVDDEDPVPAWWVMGIGVVWPAAVIPIIYTLWSEARVSRASDLLKRVKGD